MPESLQKVVDSEPELEEFEGFYLQAFWRLLSERLGGNCIPYSKIVEYGERSGLDSTMIETFVAIIWHLDRAYSKWSRGEAERRQMVAGPSPAQRAKKQVSKRSG